MGNTVRLDKYLTDMGVGTRSEVKTYIRKGRVQVDGQVVKGSDIKINITDTQVLFDNNIVQYEKFVYYMLNKPAGVVSATTDNHCTTVVELIKEANSKEIFPVGRLDKDTEGLLLLTNDGELSHQLLSPRKHVAKVYYAKVKGCVTEEDVQLFEKGVKINEEFTTLPSVLNIIKSDEISEIELTIYEGKFHQVKRMFLAVGKEVIYLKRLSMGSLKLDETLIPGEYRRLTKEEIDSLKSS
ncbi:pseudouridine synthase [Anaerocolumna sp.]|uniref:pseudouridine synthase n=1 Tax=Anaerocolumna sp. TaxID=2041569 RepID=UPI0028AC29CB|nr:pseudouridine synthase [Anaerocolumna sp.]